MTPITEEIARKVLATVDVGLVKGVGSPIPGEMCVEAAVCYAMDLPHSDDPPCVSRALRSLKIQLNDCSWSSPQARARGMRRLAVAQLGSRDVLDDQEFARRVALHAVNYVVPRALRAAASVLSDDERVSLETAAVACESATCLTAAARAANAAADAANAARAAAYAAANAARAAAYAAADAADAARAARAACAAANAAAYAARAARAAANAANAAANAANAAAYAAANAANAAAYAADAAAYAANAAAHAAAARDEPLSMFAEEMVQILVDMNAPGVQFLHLTQ